MKVGIIGSGNVATHLVKGFWKAGVEIAVVYSRTLSAAQKLAAERGGVHVTDSLDFLQAPKADIYLMAVADQALPEVAAQMDVPAGAVVAHTSGTQPLEALAGLTGGQTGVFYPLQTFSKEKTVEWTDIPICLEGSTKEAEQSLEALAQRLSRKVVLLAGPARKQLHLAAVFACNFTNHLWGVAQDILQRAALPTDLLEPLVRETMQKAFLFPPFTVQTGPAQRGDFSTIQAHLQLLETMPQYRQLYEEITQSIQDQKEKA
ncbi:DUF2520 domain-containing protein [Rufibacter immobilis]|uniref:DUF2520 domain-containing protein n=1 Tax=Rufibacter immobilis TaxID=1348778 RepID=A0A3M9N5W0_9BACT|nr:Rossmann-like and DUF2520 domain-containing protein [Rufibacter immobilis]RNI33191.1 DUF2520 domain-containing protein [Rufibacter immobilis]